MGLSFHDESSLEEVVGSLCFARDLPDPNSMGSIDLAEQERREDNFSIERVTDIERREDDFGVEQINDTERRDDEVGVERNNDIELVYR